MKRLVYKMGAEVPVAAPALGCIGAPAIDWTKALPSHFKPADIADRAIFDDAAAGEVVAIKAAVLEHGQNAIVCFGCSNHPVRFGHGQRQRLVDDNVFTGIKRSDGLVGVHSGWRRKNDQFDIRVSADILDRRDCLAASLDHDALTCCSIPACDGMEL